MTLIGVSLILSYDAVGMDYMMSYIFGLRFLVLRVYSLLQKTLINQFSNSFILTAQLSVNPDTIAVSGFSSGGCFATQFHAAFSGTVGPT